MEHRINDYKKAAKVHNSIRQKLYQFVKPGIKLLDICEFIESNIRTELPNEINSGIAFPVGVNLNNVAAHWSPQSNDTTVLGDDDVLKIDYGTHVNGNIIDSAFTYTHNTHKYESLISASREATNTVLKNVGVDSRIGELGAIAEEVVCSYEMDIYGRTIPLKPINNITGHSITQWNIHGGKLIPNIRNNNKTLIENNDILAIEVYVTTGSGSVCVDGDVSHFMLKTKPPNDNSIMLGSLYEQFRTLPFCQRYMNEPTNMSNYTDAIQSYPPLVELLDNSYISQTEHTIHINEYGNDIFSVD
jgi:methionyl aminopeptidase